MTEKINNFLSNIKISIVSNKRTIIAIAIAMLSVSCAIWYYRKSRKKKKEKQDFSSIAATVDTQIKNDKLVSLPFLMIQQPYEIQATEAKNGATCILKIKKNDKEIELIVDEKGILKENKKAGFIVKDRNIALKIYEFDAEQTAELSEQIDTLLAEQNNDLLTQTTTIDEH